jgi:RsiW-degrading membrane proteinase PrsW (M82 family)
MSRSENMKLWKTEWYWWCLFLIAAVILFRGYGGVAGGLWLGLLYAAAPMIPALAFLAWLDRLAPLGTRIWVRAIGWGMLVVTLVAGNTHVFVKIWVERLILGSGLFEPGQDVALGSIASSVLSAPMAEEAMKGLFLVLLLWSRARPIQGPWHGILAGSLVALSFGFMENGVNTARTLRQPNAPGFMEMIWQTRSVFPFLHAFFSLPMSLAIGVAALMPTVSRRVAAVFVGWLISSGLHGLWNWEVLLGKSDFSVVPWFRHAAIVSPPLIVLFLWAAHVLESRSLERYGVPAGGSHWWPRQRDPVQVQPALLRRMVCHLKRVPKVSAQAAQVKGATASVGI